MIRCRKVSLSHKEVSKLFPVHVTCFQHILENTFTYLHLSVCLGPCCLMELRVLNERKIDFGIQTFKICQSQLSESICLLYILKFTNHVLRALKCNSHFKLKCTLGMNGVRPFLSSSVLFVLLN